MVRMALLLSRAVVLLDKIYSGKMKPGDSEEVFLFLNDYDKFRSL